MKMNSINKNKLNYLIILIIINNFITIITIIIVIIMKNFITIITIIIIIKYFITIITMKNFIIKITIKNFLIMLMNQIIKINIFLK